MILAKARESDLRPPPGITKRVPPAPGKALGASASGFASVEAMPGSLLMRES